MAFTAAVLKVIASLFIVFAVEKPSLANSSSRCFWELHEVSNDINESFIYSSIWQLQQDKANFRHRRRVYSCYYYLRVILKPTLAREEYAVHPALNASERIRTLAS